MEDASTVPICDTLIESSLDLSEALIQPLVEDEASPEISDLLNDTLEDQSTFLDVSPIDNDLVEDNLSADVALPVKAPTKVSAVIVPLSA